MAVNAKESYMNTMISLLDKKTVEEITVMDIVRCNGFSRQNFYNNYRDKYDLINQIYDRDVNLAFHAVGNELGYVDLHIRVALDFLLDNQSFYKRALEYTGQNSLREHIKFLIYQYHSKLVLSKFNNGKVQQPVLNSIVFHTNCAAASIIDWILDGGEIPSHEMASLIVDSIPTMIKPYYNFKFINSYAHAIHLNGGSPYIMNESVWKTP